MEDAFLLFNNQMQTSILVQFSLLETSLYYRTEFLDLTKHIIQSTPFYGIYQVVYQKKQHTKLFNPDFDQFLDLLIARDPQEYSQLASDPEFMKKIQVQQDNYKKVIVENLPPNHPLRNQLTQPSTQ